jgi:hypothetical protein
VSSSSERTRDAPPNQPRKRGVNEEAQNVLSDHPSMSVSISSLSNSLSSVKPLCYRARSAKRRRYRVVQATGARRPFASTARVSQVVGDAISKHHPFLLDDHLPSPSPFSHRSPSFPFGLTAIVVLAFSVSCSPLSPLFPRSLSQSGSGSRRHHEPPDQSASSPSPSPVLFFCLVHFE